MEGAIRVWLEPGYDHGRFGAWMLDWPGAFVWGPTREGALARVRSAVYRFNEWLADHGELAPEPPLGMQIVEEVTAYRRPDRYEVNATFVADDRPITNDDIETTIRRLGFAREDLLSVAGRIRRAGATASAEADGRDLDGVLHHLAGAETWFVSRLEPDARFAGAHEPIETYLAESRAFLVDGLRRLPTGQRLAPRTDGKGETWTPAKVLRRAVYHSLDHLEELDRRLAKAEGRVDQVELRKNAEIDPAELRVLLVASGMTGRAHDGDELMARVVGGSTETISAWDGERLVGFARILSDEATNALISTVAVAPRWQDRGLGRRLMLGLMEGRESLKLMLDAREGTEAFYERLGFKAVSSARVRARSRSGQADRAVERHE